MAFGIQGFGLSAQFNSVSGFSGGGSASGGVALSGAAGAFEVRQALGTLLGAVQQLQVAYLGMLGAPQPFPGQPGFGSGNGFFPSQPGFGSGSGFFPSQPGFGSGFGFSPSQPGFGSGLGFFPGQPGFGSGLGFFPGQPGFGSGFGFSPSQPGFGSGFGFFPGQPGFGSGTGFFPGQPDFFQGQSGFPGQGSNSFNELLLEIARVNGVGQTQQTQTNGQTGQSLPVNVTARAYFDQNQQLQPVQSINIWELNGNNENTFNTFGSNEVFARFNNGVQGRVYRIEVTWADGRRFQIEGVNTTGNVVIDRPNR
ncbi:hypothetical protein IV102_25055 [bacterium]|nr:hypothetical protein [bacterium]